MQLVYAERSGVIKTTGQHTSSDSVSYPVRVGCEVADVRFPFDDLSASRLRYRPTAASDKTVRLSLNDIVGAASKQRWVGPAEIWESTAQRVAVITRRKQFRIARHE